MRRLFARALTLMVVTPFLSAADRNTDDKAVRDLTQRYFAAYASKDLDAFMALWSEKSPEYQARKKTMTGLFTETGPIEVKTLTIVRVRQEGQTASVRVRMELAGNDLKTGKLHALLGRLDRFLGLAREGKSWKVMRYGPSHALLMEQLVGTKSKAERLRVLDDDSDLVGPNLVVFLVRAGDAQSTQKKFNEAAETMEVAQEIATGLGDANLLAGCFWYRGNGLVRQSHYEPALVIYQKALRLYRETADQAMELTTLSSIGNVYEDLGRYPEALQQYENGLQITRDLGDREGEAKTLYNIANVYNFMKRYSEALSRYENGLRVTRDLKNRVLEAKILNNVGVAYKEMGRYTDAIRQYDDSLKIRRDLGDREGEAQVLNNIGFVYYKMEQYDKALRPYQECLAIQRKLGNRQEEAEILSVIGGIYENTSRYKEALHQYQDSLKLKRELADAKGEASVLNNIGIVYQDMGRNTEALPYYLDSLKLRHSLKDRAGEAETLNNIGTLYYDTSRYTEALQQYQESVKIAHELGDRKGEAQTLCNVGNVEKAMGRYDDALQHYRDGLQVARDLKDRGGEAAALQNLGGVYYATGAYDEALHQYQDSLKINRELANRKGEVLILNGVGAVYVELSRYQEALQQYQDALKIARDWGDRPGEEWTVCGIGIVYASMGRYEEALQQYQEGLKIAREVGDRAKESQILSDIGFVYGETGRYGEALRQHQDGLKITRQVGNPAQESGILRYIGIVYLQTGQYAEALQYLQDSLKIARTLRDRKQELLALNNIASAYENSGDYAEALRRYQEGLNIARDLKDRAREGGVLNNMAIVYRMTRRYSEALQTYQDSLTISRDLKDRGLEANTLCNLGNIYLDTDRYADALLRYQDSLKIERDLGDRSGESLNLGNIGIVYQALKQWKDAEQALRESVRGIERLRIDARDPSLQSFLLAQKTDSFFRLAECELELGKPDEAFLAGERMKARGLVDILQQGKANLRRGMSAADQAQEEKLQERLASLGRELEGMHSRKVDVERQTALAGELDKARQEYEDFHRDLFLHRPDLATRRAEFAPASLGDLGVSLFAGRSGLVVLSYLVGEKETLLFVLTAPEKEGDAARLTVHRLDVESKDLAEAVAAFRDGCSDPEKGEPSADDLYRWLITPAADELAGAKQVVLVPDGVLHTLPFQALRDPDGKYLIEGFAVSYAPSVTALTKMEELGVRRRKEYAGKPASLLAVCVSDFGRRERPLPAAEKETRAVAAAFGDGAKLLSGAEATRAKLVASWMGRRYLHFATHGRLNPDAPLYSSLVLHSGGGDEGVLFAHDLVDADVPAELAVMSACQTGLGRHVSGEGLLGLSWSWFAAGVPSTVASQWSVGDDSTARLMNTFYARLKAGEAKAEALRQAELSLLKDDATRHPFYWAPFVLVGDDR